MPLGSFWFVYIWTERSYDLLCLESWSDLLGILRSKWTTVWLHVDELQWTDDSVKISNCLTWVPSFLFRLMGWCRSQTRSTTCKDRSQSGFVCSSFHFAHSVHELCFGSIDVRGLTHDTRSFLQRTCQSIKT